MSQNYRPISCDLHDYLEIACMHGMDIEVQTESKCFIGKAKDIDIRRDKTEWLVCEIDGLKEAVRLDQLISIEPVSDRNHFGKIIFKEKPNHPAK